MVPLKVESLFEFIQGSLLATSNEGVELVGLQPPVEYEPTRLLVPDSGARN
jgi:hypothetical protein